MTTHAFIFARGGSKGVPRKNVRLLGGVPLISHAIRCAAMVEQITSIFVSTDDAEIGEVATAEGASVIRRPEELATDSAPEWLAWRHAVDWVEERHGAFDVFVSTPATTPFREPVDIRNGLTAFADGDADACIALTESAANPYFNMVTIAADGALQMAASLPGGVVRRQEAPPVFDIAGAVYVTTPRHIRTAERLFDGRVRGFQIPRERAVDIDEPIDFAIAEALMKIRSEA